MQIAIFGGSGFVGKHLAERLQARGDSVRAVSLRDPKGAAAAAAGSDVVVNLSGESVGQRWTNEIKRRIRESRTTLPAQFFAALEHVEPKPAAYISASAVGYYGASEEATFTEQSPPGQDFLAQVCVEWERVAQSGRNLGMRVACIRSGLAFGSDGGALARILPIFRSGAGGRIGSGKQWMSWIHIDDLVAIYMLAIDRIEGAVNATSPNPVTNQEFTETLAKALHRPAALPVPAFALKLMLGEGADALLSGQRVVPARLQAENYSFKYPMLASALTHILNS